ncbi:MAG: hypothetical protein KC933_31345, partial [Myxococcales bacterium]|nr:hypothetical protein [Myxococcales bacterium]
PDQHLLPEALILRFKRHLSVAFRLLEIRYPARTVQLVYSNLDSDNKAVRANALEVVDNVLAKEESRILLPLLEDHGPAEKVGTGKGFFSLEHRDKDAWLDRLVEGPEPWLTTCTLHLIGEERMVDLTERITPQLRSTDAVVRETAFVTLSRLVKVANGDLAEELKAGLREAARRAANDQADNVRQASGDLLQLL